MRQAKRTKRKRNKDKIENWVKHTHVHKENRQHIVNTGNHHLRINYTFMEQEEDEVENEE